MTKLFLDSSFIISLINSNDSLHNRALILKDQYLKNNECYISNLIINEVVTIVGNKMGLDIALQSYNLLTNLCTVINEYDDLNFNYEVITEYQKFNTKLSFTDTSIIIIMKKYGINKLLSFDKEFKRVKNIEIIK